MTKRLYKPVYDEHGKLDHYQVIDRDTGNLIGVRDADFREDGMEFVESLMDNPFHGEAMEKYLEKERETETSTRLKKIEERLEDVPVELAEAFTTFISPMTEKIILNVHESQTLAAIRDALLPKLMSGEVRVDSLETVSGGSH